MNKPLGQLDLATGVLARGAVADKDLTAAPGSPSDGDCYIVASGATGDWASQDGKLAFYDSTNAEWVFYSPVEGLRVWLQDEDCFYQYAGTAWVQKIDPYIIGAYYPGTPTDGLVVLKHSIAIDMSLPSNLSGSYAKASTAASASTVFKVAKNGTDFATITFASAGTAASITATATSFSAGDILTITAPATADASIAVIDFTLKGTKD
jgi:hypothetical protein